MIGDLGYGSGWENWGEFKRAPSNYSSVKKVGTLADKVSTTLEQCYGKIYIINSISQGICRLRER